MTLLTAERLKNQHSSIQPLHFQEQLIVKLEVSQTLCNKTVFI